MSNPFSRAAIRREFPIHKFAEIVRANGSISKAALRERFSAYGCPNAKPDVAVALIKSGANESQAIQLAILAAYVTDQHGPMIEPIERTSSAILRAAKEESARRAPWGKEAEDRAARFEDRPSRWNTADFHDGAFRNINSIRTNYYPCAPFGPVQR